MTESTTHCFVAILGMPGGWEWIIVLGIALLIFGKRLPEVGRSVGKSIVEFKKGIKSIDDDIDYETNKSSGAPKLDQKASYSEHHDPATGGEKSPYATDSSGDSKD